MKTLFRVIPYLYFLLAFLTGLSVGSTFLKILAAYDQYDFDGHLPTPLLPLISFIAIGSIIFAIYIINGLLILRRIKRSISLLLSALSCLALPFGTIVGVLSLITLTREGIKAEYAEQGAAANP